MIGRREILDMATRLSLQPHVIEKDYVLGWTLAGISAHDTLRDSWIFKGGTCIKKCFFETYRFSEDLDFTLRDGSQLDGNFLDRTFKEIGAWIYEHSGIQFFEKQSKFNIRLTPRGTTACEGRLYYRGPVSSHSSPRLKLDLTAAERMVLPPKRATVFHPYSDSPLEGFDVLAYAFEELFAEKVRALAERARPRDLYDVVNFFRNSQALPPLSVFMHILGQKCEFKEIGVPSLETLEPHRSELERDWEYMLGHQLPMLPLFESFWEELPKFFAWLASGVTTNRPQPYAMGAGEIIIRQRDLKLRDIRQAQAIEIIRFSAFNRLVVELGYQGSTRRIEPYSLRRTQEGNVLLHAWNRDKNEHRSYRVDRIQGAHIANQTFSPRYEIELSPIGSVHVGDAINRSQSATPRPAIMRGSIGSGQAVYTYQCPICQKRFRRSQKNAVLNAHKNDWGRQCPGRVGYLLTSS